jgi:hypothetical protein
MVRKDRLDRKTAANEGDGRGPDTRAYLLARPGIWAFHLRRSRTHGARSKHFARTDSLEFACRLKATLSGAMGGLLLY